MIKAGLNRLIEKGYDWPPSAPEFSRLCKPSAEDFNLPTLDESIEQIGRLMNNKNTKLHPFVYTLYKNLNGRWWDLTRMVERDYRRELRRYHERLVEHVVNGGDLLSQPEFIEKKEPEPKQADPAEVEKRMAEIKEKVRA